MTDNRDYRTGILCILGCQLMWGFLPIYWQSLEPIESRVIILYRIVTMFVFSYVAARSRYSREEIWGPLRDKAVRRKYFLAGLILTVNWSLYIWAMTSEHVIQASIGYYIEPLMICAVGAIAFKEKLNAHSVIAMCFALAAIILILVHVGQLPLVGLGLASTWAIYSAIKKTAEQPALLSQVFETMPYAVISIFAIIYIECRGIGGLSYGVPGKYAMMFLSGLLTLMPMTLFAMAARKVTLLVIGLTQYISPTISLLLGIFLFKEPIDRTQIIAFIIIWTGLAIFTYGEIRGSNKEITQE